MLQAVEKSSWDRDLLDHFHNGPEGKLQGQPVLYILQAADVIGSLVVNDGCQNAFDFAVTAYCTQRSHQHRAIARRLFNEITPTRRQELMHSSGAET